MVNCDKKPMFSPEQRLELIRRSVADLPNVEAELFTAACWRITPGRRERVFW